MKNKNKLFEQFKEIPDYRKHKHKIVYPLEEILFMTLCALLQGRVDYDDIHRTFPPQNHHQPRS